MLPRMSDKEKDLFLSFVRKSNNYVEFGTGGSTFLASNYVENSIISVDSSAEWLSNVQSSCVGHKVAPKLIYVDIGPTGDWGMPIDKDTQSRWPRYYEAVWDEKDSKSADLYMVDGRFRVACFASVIINCHHNAIIGFHDFASRKHYHCIHEIAREIACAADMSFFQPRAGVGEAATKILEKYRLNPA